MKKNFLILLLSLVLLGCNNDTSQSKSLDFSSKDFSIQSRKTTHEDVIKALNIENVIVNKKNIVNNSKKWVSNVLGMYNVGDEVFENGQPLKDGTYLFINMDNNKGYVEAIFYMKEGKILKKIDFETQSDYEENFSLIKTIVISEKSKTKEDYNILEYDKTINKRIEKTINKDSEAVEMKKYVNFQGIFFEAESGYLLDKDYLILTVEVPSTKNKFVGFEKAYRNYSVDFLYEEYSNFYKLSGKDFKVDKVITTVTEDKSRINKCIILKGLNNDYVKILDSSGYVSYFYYKDNNLVKSIVNKNI